MPIPGNAPSSTSWATTFPGWQKKDPRVAGSPITVNLAGLHLESRPARSDDYRDLFTLDGWWDGVERRSETLPRPDADGLHQGPVYLGARPIAVTGSIYARDRRTLLEAMEAYGSPLMSGNRLGLFTVAEPERGLTRQAQVSVSSATVTPRSDRFADVSWVLRAVDPIRYDVTETRVDIPHGATVDAVLAGNTAVPFLLDLIGPLTNPSVWIDGAQWKLNRTIPAGTTVIAYWADLEVMSGSTSLAHYQQGPWPWLKPGKTPVGLSADAGTGSARIRGRSGWL